ncbi:hypothetical protein ABUK73_20975 [Agrobacterium sp. BA1120]|uniref:hypothetical protein n=1 Tax=Agrobacterium sp. BA1120 TaxID=3228927 RepID=UPI003369FDC9
MRPVLHAAWLASFLLVAGLAFSGDEWPLDWSTSRCSPEVKAFIAKSKIHDIYRTRPRNGSGKSEVIAEIGDPNAPGQQGKYADWLINIRDASPKSRSSFYKSLERGSWVVFKADGDAKNPGYDQRLFYIEGGRCRFKGPTSEAGKDELPDEVDRFVRSALDIEIQQQKSLLAALFGDARPSTDQNQSDTELSALRSSSTALDRTTDSEGAPKSTLPVPVLEKIAQIHEQCGWNGANETEMSGTFVKEVDVNGDGKTDWVLDGHEIWCSKEGKKSPGVEGPYGFPLWIIIDTPSGPKMVDQISQDVGVIRRHANFATISFDDGQKLQMRGTTITPINRVPPGGQVVFEMRK